MRIVPRAIVKGVTAASVCLVVVLASPSRADVITDWNQTAIAAMKAANIAGNPWSRNMAMVHVAMSDAVNSVQNKYAIYAPGGAPASSASAEAAAAAAARTVLLQQVPAQKALIDQAFEASTKDIPDGAAKKDGIAIGEKCGAAIMADRASDGTTVPDTYRPVTSPGVWIPTTPPIAEYARATPWVMKSADQVRPARHRISRASSMRATTTRPRRWAAPRAPSAPPSRSRPSSSGPSSISGRRGRRRRVNCRPRRTCPLAENARLFALLNMGTANTFITDWDAKFTYNFWRPVTAIRNGDQDGNDATERDAAWTPLNATPMHPEYPSQAAIIAGVSMGVLEAVFGANPSTPVVASDLIDPKAQRRYANVKEMADEVQNVRIWGGVHFRNSLDVGYQMGRKIAVFLVENSIKPMN